MHTHSPENYMKTGYPLGMVLYNKFLITFLSLSNCQLIKKFQNKQSRKYFQKHIGINRIGTNVLMVN